MAEEDSTQAEAQNDWRQALLATLERAKEEPLIPISREKAIVTTIKNLEYWEQKGVEAQLNIQALRNSLGRMLELEALGLRVEYFQRGESIGFTGRERGPAGFSPLRENTGRKENG